MFNNSKDKAETGGQQRDSSASGINSLGSNTTIKGDITSQADIRLDGRLVGNLTCEGKVILGSKGHIKGEISCTNAVVEGTIEGSITVRDHLVVKESAKIEGEIITSKLTVQSGAVFNVKCDMGGQTIAPKSMSSVKTA